MYIRSLSVDELAARLEPFIADAGISAGIEQIKEVVPLIQERISTLADAPPLVGFLWSDVSPGASDLVPGTLDAERTALLIDLVADSLAEVAPWSHEAIEAALRALADSAGLKPRDAFQPVRVALTGSRVSPPLFESAALLGRERCVQRLRAASALLGVGSPA
jgi:glutamyl-tRNA synthetase